MREMNWLRTTSPAFQLMLATSWLAPDSHREMQNKAVQKGCAAQPDWNEFLQLIDRHRTPASSWAVLQRTPNAFLPQSIRNLLRESSDLSRRQAMLHLQVLAEVLKSLSQSGIPAMPLKGPLLSFALYGDAGLRQSKDLDILVPESEVRPTQELLEKLGWSLDPEYFPLSPRQWEVNLRHENHVGYIHPRHRCQLEVHWRWSSPQKMEQDWARSKTTELSGLSYRVMSQADLAIYLAAHGAAHQWFRAKWLGDLARLHCNGQVDWLDVLAQAQSIGQERPVLLALHLLRDCFDFAFPEVPANLWKTLPPLSVESSIRALTARSEPIKRNGWLSLKEGIKTFIRNRALWPHTSWKSVAVYSRLDLKILCLPDKLFWLYVPLRPILWFWRRFGMER